MQKLDEWLNLIDTHEVLPLFAQKQRSYTSQILTGPSLNDSEHQVAQALLQQEDTPVRRFQSLRSAFDLLKRLIMSNERVIANRLFRQLADVEYASASPRDQTDAARGLLEILPNAPYLISPFFKSHMWRSQKEQLRNCLSNLTLKLLKCLILVDHALHRLIHNPMRALLRETDELSMHDLTVVIELMILTVKDPDIALDLLMDCIEPGTSRLLKESSPAYEGFSRKLIGVALNYIGSIGSLRSPPSELIHLTPDELDHDSQIVKAIVRIDSPLQQLRFGHHIQLQAAGTPQDAPLQQPYAMDATVVSVSIGQIMFRCLQKIPPYVEACDWTLMRIGSFSKTKAILQAILTFHDGKERTCRLYPNLVGSTQRDQAVSEATVLPFSPYPTLNDSQNQALKSAMSYPVSIVWAPAGTGKMRTVMAILEQLLLALPEQRILVTAPTHNAVNNVLERFVGTGCHIRCQTTPLRLATAVSIPIAFYFRALVWRSLGCHKTRRMRFINFARC